MRIIFEPTGTLEGLRSALETLNGAGSVQILGAVGNGWTPSANDRETKVRPEFRLRGARLADR